MSSGRADAALKDEASKFPASFALKAKTLAIEAINTGSVSAMQGAMAILRMTGASVGGVHLLLTLPALWCVAALRLQSCTETSRSSQSPHVRSSSSRARALRS